MQVTLTKLSNFILSSKIPKVNQMLISYFPFITLLIVPFITTTTDVAVACSCQQFLSSLVSSSIRFAGGNKTHPVSSAAYVFCFGVLGLVVNNCQPGYLHFRHVTTEFSPSNPGAYIIYHHI
jgi:hypothetical protein